VFLTDYWGPVCRFALRRGNGKLEDAEDVAAKTFEIIVSNDLLERWASQPRARLRTLLCGVVCKVQANQFRVAAVFFPFESTCDLEQLTRNKKSSSVEPR